MRLQGGTGLRRLGGNLLLLLVSLALSAAAAELFFRTLPARSGIKRDDGELKYRFNPYRPDPVLSYALRENASAVHHETDFQVVVHTNALGLRGGPVSPEKAAGAYRILVIGDSFAFGFGVEDDEALPPQLAAELSLLRPGAEALNAGMPGWSADDYYLFLETRGFELEPDLVLMAPTENDPGDLFWKDFELDGGNLPTRIRSTRRVIDHRGRMRYRDGVPSFEFPGSAWLEGRSHLWNAVRFRLTALWVRVSQAHDRRRLRREAGDPPERAIAELQPDEVQRGLLTGSAFQLRYHRYLMDAIRRSCEQRGVPVRTLLVAFRDSESAADPAAQALHEDCARSPRLCLDTRGLFSPDELDQVFFPSDGHWTPIGHRRVASVVARWLADDPELALAGE
jgi:hypothetical protein